MKNRERERESVCVCVCLVSDGRQVSLSNFWKISVDEYVQRLIRQDLLEQKLNFMRLKLSSSSESEYASLLLLRFFFF
jgi:hypothetical protein